MDTLSLLNQNSYLAAISMLMLNLGSRYLVMDITRAQEQLLKNWVVRRLTLFCIFYVATRDALVSLVLTTIVVVLLTGFFHEDSRMCVLPTSMREHKITYDEYVQAKRVVDGFEKQKNGFKP